MKKLTEEQHIALIAHTLGDILTEFEPKGLTPEALFEGALKGGVIALMATRDMDLTEIADLLDDVADSLRAGAANEAPSLN